MNFLPGCADSASDRFYATLKLTSFEFSTIQFCLGYWSAGQESWDNNGGKNYVIRISQPKRRFGAGLNRLDST